MYDFYKILWLCMFFIDCWRHDKLVVNGLYIRMWNYVFLMLVISQWLQSYAKWSIQISVWSYVFKFSHLIGIIGLFFVWFIQNNVYYMFFIDCWRHDKLVVNEVYEVKCFNVRHFKMIVGRVFCVIYTK